MIPSKEPQTSITTLPTHHWFPPDADFHRLHQPPEYAVVNHPAHLIGPDHDHHSLDTAPSPPLSPPMATASTRSNGILTPTPTPTPSRATFSTPTSPAPRTQSAHRRSPNNRTTTPPTPPQHDVATVLAQACRKRYPLRRGRRSGRKAQGEGGGGGGGEEDTRGLDDILAKHRTGTPGNVSFETLVGLAFGGAERRGVEADHGSAISKAGADVDR